MPSNHAVYSCAGKTTPPTHDVFSAGLLVTEKRQFLDSLLLLSFSMLIFRYTFIGIWAIFSGRVSDLTEGLLQKIVKVHLCMSVWNSLPSELLVDG